MHDSFPCALRTDITYLIDNRIIKFQLAFKGVQLYSVLFPQIINKSREYSLNLSTQTLSTFLTDSKPHVYILASVRLQLVSILAIVTSSSLLPMS